MDSALADAQDGRYNFSVGDIDGILEAIRDKGSKRNGQNQDANGNIIDDTDENTVRRKYKKEPVAGDEVRSAPGASLDGNIEEGQAAAAASSVVKPLQIEGSSVTKSNNENCAAINERVMFRTDPRMEGRGMDESSILLEWDLDFDQSKSSHNSTNDLAPIITVSLSSENVYPTSTTSVDAGGIDFPGNVEPEEEVANSSAADNNIKKLDLSDSYDENSPTIDICNKNEVEVVVEEAQSLNPLSSKIRLSKLGRLGRIEKDSLKEGTKKYFNEAKDQLTKEGRTSYRVMHLATKVLDLILYDPGKFRCNNSLLFAR